MHPDIERLIVMASKGEAITNRQREIIRNKAVALGEDPDEAEILLDLSFKTKKKTTSEGIVNSHVQEDKVCTPVFQERVDVAETQNDSQRRHKIKTHNKIIFGVCAKLAKYLKIDTWIVRLIVLILGLLLTFLSFQFYIGLLWSLLVPVIYLILSKVLPEPKN